jgi:hypothetical protein
MQMIEPYMQDRIRLLQGHIVERPRFAPPQQVDATASADSGVGPVVELGSITNAPPCYDSAPLKIFKKKWKAKEANAVVKVRSTIEY